MARRRCGNSRSTSPLGLHKVQNNNETTTYSKQVAKERRAKLSTLETNIQKYAMKCDKYPTAENLNNFEICQTEYDR